MSNINNGGPAFPAGSVRKSRPAHDAGGDWVETDRVQPLHKGLTIRDYFAAKASEEDIAEYLPATVGEAKLYPNHTRQWARYKHADAMLRARGEA
jgi:hypothetical protein